MRKVQIVGTTIVGSFHTWGLDQHPNSSRLRLVGVVELEDGTIQTHNASDIQFIKEVTPRPAALPPSGPGEIGGGWKTR